MMTGGKVYKIASVCGAGLATSTWIATKLKESLAERGIESEITEVKVMDLSLSAANYDLIVSASNLGDVYGVPVVVSTSILTGIGFEDTIEEIVQILEESKE
jgi:PTS system galactitol-specific IIB component